MKFPHPLHSGIILNRYKRFLCDVELDHGELITAHTPNTGSMKTCWEKGWPVLLSRSPLESNRKYPYTLEMVHNGRTWIGVNTMHPNRLVEEAILQDRIPELLGYPQVLRERKVGESRIDLCLQRGAELCYVEVKNVTLWGEENRGYFPDAVSARGVKHLRTLIDLKRQGNRSAIFFVVQREDIDLFSPAFQIDPLYSETLRQAHEEGVEILTYRCHLTPEEIYLERKLPFSLLNPASL